MGPCSLTEYYDVKVLSSSAIFITVIARIVLESPDELTMEKNVVGHLALTLLVAIMSARTVSMGLFSQPCSVQVWSLSRFEVSRQLLTNDLNQVSSVSLLMTASTALAN